MAVSVEVSPLDVIFPSGVFPSACPSRVVLDHITSKWGVLVLVALTGRTLRWGELRRRVEGISEKMLAQTLQWLEQDGFVKRIAHQAAPPHVEYKLTPLGEALSARVREVLDWIEDNFGAIQVAQQRQADAAAS